MTKQTAISLTDETHERLKVLSERTGRTPLSYIHEAIERHIEDLEDVHAADEAMERLARGEERTHTLEEVERELGLEG